ncbi:MAG: hypothetical protein SCALA702_17020 [Melioribacteraceae bacterium]|nr:MAG: hypothetical protein SCALA702_17020 [Melioribacteraceae bacterium]
MTVEEKAKWFDAALKFAVEGDIQLVMKARKNGTSSWAIVNTSTQQVFNSNMEWEEELPLAKRDERFLTRTRFSFDDAVNLLKMKKMYGV